MSLIKHSPFNTDFQSVVKRFFNDEDFFSYSPLKHFDGDFNVKETDKNYEVEIPAIGFKKENIKIEVENDIIKVSGKVEESNEKYLKKGFYRNSFEKSFILPENVDKDSISANYEDDILYLTLDKTVKEKPKSKLIEVK